MVEPRADREEADAIGRVPGGGKIYPITASNRTWRRCSGWRMPKLETARKPKMWLNRLPRNRLLGSSGWNEMEINSLRRKAIAKLPKMPSQGARLKMAHSLHPCFKTSSRRRYNLVPR